MKASLWGLVLLAMALSASAQKPKLPEPLTLEAALSIAAEQSSLTSSPEVMLAMARESQAVAEQQAQQVKEAFQMRLDASLGRREFNAHEEEFNTSYAVLHKQLYDFNRTDALIAAAEQQRLAQEQLTSLARQQYRQAVIDAFYAVIIADARFRVENEQLAIEYVTLDHAREEAAVKKMSELDLLALEATYQRTVVRRTEAENQQRVTRAALAELLGYPNSLPEECVMPVAVKGKKRDLSDIKTLQNQALANNKEVQALNFQLQAAESRLAAAQAMDMPRIDALGRVGWHSQVAHAYEGRWRYDLALTLPLVDGGLKAAEVDKAKADLMRVRAQKLAVERQLRQSVLETALTLDALKGRQTQVKVAGDYAERVLDRSRTEYQFERKTDLGDAMVQATKAELEAILLARDTALLTERLTILLGETP